MNNLSSSILLGNSAQRIWLWMSSFSVLDLFPTVSGVKYCHIMFKLTLSHPRWNLCRILIWWLYIIPFYEEYREPIRTQIGRVWCHLLTKTDFANYGRLWWLFSFYNWISIQRINSSETKLSTISSIWPWM